MLRVEDIINTVICGEALSVLKTIPDNSVNCCVTSPPYWNLRDYGVRGQSGLEKTFEEYIFNLCNIFDEVKRVLRKDGTCWVNLGDSYGGFQGKNAGWPDSKTKAKVPQQLKPKHLAKSLMLIPQRFAIEMVNRGWILRNTVIWKKNNCMPSSAKDRFTVDFEYIYFFCKSNKTQFWTNEKTGDCVRKKPLGTKGIEGKDWEWRPCPRCQSTGGVTKIEKENAESMGSPRARYHRITKQEICKRCKGLGKIKISFWDGHDYWFEQAFEKYQYPLDRWGGVYTDGNVPNSKYLKEDIDPAQITKRPRSFRPNEQGRNKRAVWEIPTKPFPEAHFAVYPEKLIEPMIEAGCPRYVCKKCGKARVKILDRSEKVNAQWGERKSNTQKFRDKREMPQKVIKNVNVKEMGYTDCGCRKLTCLSCGTVLYYTKEEYEREVNNAIQEHRKKTGVYEELDEVQISKEPRKSKKCPEEIQENMSNMQKGIYDKKKSDMLQSEMCGKETSDRRDSQQLEIEGRKESQLEGRKTEDTGVFISSYPKSSESDKGWIYDGTSPCNGEISGQIFGGMGRHSSQERNKRRQQNREFGVNDSQNPSGESVMPSLSEMVFDKITCPKCKLNKFKVESAGFEGGICLDPFMGAGTTAMVAKKQGKRYIGIEIKQEYIDMANKRVRKVPKLLF